MPAFFSSNFTYDSYGRLSTLTHPSGIVETMNYNGNGYLSSISAGGATRFTITGMNAREQLTGSTYGSSLTATYGFDAYGYVNGRLYDPLVGRFLSSDNFVQDPSFTQSYNRYSYCWNNPLKYTDPSGNLLPLVRSDFQRSMDEMYGVGNYWYRGEAPGSWSSAGFGRPGYGEGYWQIKTRYTVVTRTIAVGEDDPDPYRDTYLKRTNELVWVPAPEKKALGQEGNNDSPSPMLPHTDVQQAGIGGEHLIGPALIAAGQPWIPKASAFAKAIFPRSTVALGASEYTSLASLSLRRLSTSLGASFVGGTVAKFVPAVGWAWTFYDVVDYTVGWDRVLTPAKTNEWVPNRAVFPDGTTIYVCFKAGTQILAKEGLKPIEQIIVGDSVYSYNIDKNTVELSKVVKSFERNTNEIYELTTTNQKIYVTAEHPFYVNEKGWIKVKDLQVGFELKTNTNKKEGIVSIRRHQRPETVYNIEVEENHNYFVTGSSILVHNK